MAAVSDSGNIDLTEKTEKEPSEDQSSSKNSSSNNDDKNMSSDSNAQEHSLDTLHENTDCQTTVVPGNSANDSMSVTPSGDGPFGDNDENDSLSNSDDDYESTLGDSDLEDFDENEEVPYPSQRILRMPNPPLPDTVTTLETDEGSKVYLIGTAHFSKSSEEDVAKTIELTQPDVVLLELCNSRVNLLELDEDALLEAAKNIDMAKVNSVIKQNGVVQGILHLLLLSLSSHLTKELGMAPGGEFRRAFKEAQTIPGCRVLLGDRPIQITLRRAFGALTVWQKIKLVWHMITSKGPISKEDVEKCKQRDLLEEMLREMTGEFPTLSKVFVEERDMYIAHNLRMAAQSIPHPPSPTGYVPSVVVGVVGIGHVPGITSNWLKDNDIKTLLVLPRKSIFSSVFRWTFRATLVGLISWGVFRAIRYYGYA